MVPSRYVSKSFPRVTFIHLFIYLYIFLPFDDPSSINLNLRSQRAGRMGVGVRSTKHEERGYTKSGGVSPGGSEFGPVLGGGRHGAVDSS